MFSGLDTLNFGQYEKRHLFERERIAHNADYAPTTLSEQLADGIGDTFV